MRDILFEENLSFPYAVTPLSVDQHITPECAAIVYILRHKVFHVLDALMVSFFAKLPASI